MKTCENSHGSMDHEVLRTLYPADLRQEKANGKPLWKKSSEGIWIYANKRLWIFTVTEST